MSKLSEQARRRAERCLAIMVEHPILIIDVEKAARHWDRVARDRSIPRQKAANAAYRATAYYLLVAEVMERVEAKRKAEAERN